MADGIVLSENDRQLLRDLIADWRREVLSTTGRPPVEFDDHQAPEVYVAIAPAGGIPARVSTVPGSALCTIYRFDEVDDVIRSVPGLQKLVYNLATSAVTAGDWVLAARDKYGDWYVTDSFAGGGDVGTGTGDGILEVKVTGETPDAQNRYAAIEQIFNPATLAWSDGNVCWLVEANNCGLLKAGNRYTAHHIGASGNRPLYVRDDFDLTIRYHDETDPYNNILYHEYDKTDFITSNNGTRRVKIRTNGYTGTVGPFYKYACVSGVLTQYTSAGFTSTDGLVKGNISGYA